MIITIIMMIIIVIIISMTMMMKKMILRIVVVIIIINSLLQPGDFSTGSTTASAQNINNWRLWIRKNMLSNKRINH